MAVATGPSKSEMNKSSVLLPSVESATCWARWCAAHTSSRASPAGIILVLWSQVALCTLQSPARIMLEPNCHISSRREST